MSDKEISDKMNEGYENHTINSTVMNVTSSRAYRTVKIEFNQIKNIGTKKVQNYQHYQI